MASGSGTGLSMDDFESLMSISEVDLLKKAWRNEKASPEILPLDTSLIDRSREQIQLMDETISDFTSSPSHDPLHVSIYQMDLDRVHYLLRSYLRTRLLKIHRHVAHILNTDRLWARLSEEEKRFARRAYQDVKSYLEESVLEKLPVGYRSDVKQSSASEEEDMVVGPDLDTFVFCRSEGNVGSLPMEDSGEEIVDLVAGDLYVLRYRSIKSFVENGRIDLV